MAKENLKEIKRETTMEMIYMSKLASQGAFQKQMSSVDQAVYTKRERDLWNNFKRNKKTKQTHSKSLMSPSCRSRLLPSGDGHFSRERKREKSDDIWYYVEESTVTTKKKFAIQMSFNDAPGQQSLRREEIKKSLFSSIPKNKYKYVLLLR